VKSVLKKQKQRINHQILLLEKKLQYHISIGAMFHFPFAATTGQAKRGKIFETK